MRSGASVTGDVDNITKPNLWFLYRGKSWDKKDKTTYLAISYYRSIQPGALEPYFAALVSPDPQQNVLKLMASPDPTLVDRVLTYPFLTRDKQMRLDFPVTPWFFSDDPGVKPPLKEGMNPADWVNATRAVIESKDTDDARWHAATTLASLQGAECVPAMRQLLADKNPKVRAAAAIELLRFKDTDSIDRIVQVVSGIQDRDLSMNAIGWISGWDDIRLVPALIAFLQNDGNGNFLVDVLATQANETLEKLTGHWFPYDVQTSQAAWKQAAQLDDAEKRKQLLENLLPADRSPLKAEIIGDGGLTVICKVSNQSPRDVTITKFPSNLGSAWLLNAPPFVPKGGRDFITLKPGASTQFKIKLDQYILQPDVEPPGFSMDYLRTGRQWGEKAWVGEVTFGADYWKKARKYKEIAETWPNGKPKAQGQMVDGKKYGEWKLFNEEGRWIKSVKYESDGTVTETDVNYPPENAAPDASQPAK